MLFYLGLGAWVNGGSGWELAADYATNPDLAADYADGRRSGRKAGATMTGDAELQKGGVCGIAAVILCWLTTGGRYSQRPCKQRDLA